MAEFNIPPSDRIIYGVKGRRITVEKPIVAGLTGSPAISFLFLKRWEKNKSVLALCLGVNSCDFPNE